MLVQDLWYNILINLKGMKAMKTQVVLEIVETELSRAKEGYDAVVLAERFRNEENNGDAEERYEGLKLAIKLFKETYSRGKQSCLDCLSAKRAVIKPQREIFLEGDDFVFQIVSEWECVD